MYAHPNAISSLGMELQTLQADFRVLGAEFSPLEEQQVILTSEPSLQPRKCTVTGLDTSSSQQIATVM